MSTDYEKEKLTPVAWQQFGKEWCLTGQFGMRPIFLSTNKHSGFRLLKDGLLAPFTPDHPHAQRMADAWNEHDELKKENARLSAELDECKKQLADAKLPTVEHVQDIYELSKLRSEITLLKAVARAAKQRAKAVTGQQAYEALLEIKRTLDAYTARYGELKEEG